MSKQINKEVAREQLALALILLKDFKCEGRMDMEVCEYIFLLAEQIGVLEEYNDLICKIPVMKIEPKYKD